MFFLKSFNFYSRNLKSPLHIVSYSLTIEVSVMELKGAELLISHAFQRKCYISIARTGNCMMYALGPFSRKRSHSNCIFV